MFEYIVTVFKVVAGVITNERLVIASLVALGILLLWVVFSLCFSFEMRFLSCARRINNHISRNGVEKENDLELEALVQKMPGEFVRGFRTFKKEKKGLPSKYIKRANCLDLELNGGVFNQNRSIIKSFINMVFFALMIFAFAIMSNSSLIESGASKTETSLTGYMVAEALLIPLLFMLIAKSIYYVYTAIRQHQYHVAVEEFNEMIDNFDNAVSFIETTNVQVQPTVFEQENNVAFEKQEKPVEIFEERVYDDDFDDLPPTGLFGDELEEAKEIPVQENEDQDDVDQEIEESSLTNENPEVEEVFQAREENVVNEEFQPKEEPEVLVQTDENVENLKIVEEEQNNFEENEGEEMADEQEIKDNFKTDFSTLLGSDESEEVQTQKRGRGRPKKEVKDGEEFVIKTDKEFEEALVRAEKLMRKNEEPLSASQTKRIEKQLKELIDAMSKYKENK